MPRVNINNKYNNGRTGGNKVFLEPAKSEIYFADSTQIATEGQTIFTATFPINQVFKNNVIVDVSAYTGQGTNQITFTSGLSASDYVYLTT
mgnify:CR=1 FL=1